MSRDQESQVAEDSIRRDAAAWFARMRADQATERERARFARWLNADPQHRTAYERIERVWSMAGGFADREEIQSAVAEGKRSLETETLASSRSRLKRRWFYGAAAAASVAALGIFVMPSLVAGDDYTTRIGEQRTVALADGSKITLNTDSRVRVHYSQSERHIELQRGEVYFRVAKDASRPFNVATHRGSIQAVGTEFDVSRQEQDVAVMLIEGRVLLREANGGEPVMLEAGQGALLDNDASAPSPAPIVVERSVAWLRGRVVFDDDTLADAVAELNRYSQTRIELNDAAMGHLRITGVFATDRNETFVSAVTGAFPIDAEVRPDGSYLLKAR